MLEIRLKEGIESLGKYPSFSLSNARSKANEFNAILDNPQYRRERKHPKALLEQDRQKQKTFFEVSQEWISTQDQTPSFERTKSNRIKNHLYPTLKDKTIDSLTRKDFIECIQKLQDSNTLETSKRIFLIARSIMRFAVNRGYIENSLLGDIDFKQTFKPPKPQNYKAIKSEARFRDLLLAIEEYKGNPITKLALQISPYIFLRANNIRGLKWEYINLKKKQIIIPSSEMKMREEFMIPLCESVIKIIEEVRRYSHASSYVFPSDISKSRCVYI